MVGGRLNRPLDHSARRFLRVREDLRGIHSRDIGLTIHPHPTLSETIGMAAEAFEGTITDLYMPKKQPKTAH